MENGMDVSYKLGKPWIVDSKALIFNGSLNQCTWEVTLNS